MQVKCDSNAELQLFRVFLKEIRVIGVIRVKRLFYCFVFGGT
jgi:hypothetical protein